MSVEFDTPANRIIQQLQPKNQFRVDTSLPDIAFLRQLSVQGRLRFFQGGGLTPITITPNVGETLFIYGGTYNMFSSAGSITVTITNDGTTRESLFTPQSTMQNGTLGIFDSLVGDNIKQFTVVANRTGANFSLFGWVENTARIRDVTT